MSHPRGQTGQRPSADIDVFVEGRRIGTGDNPQPDLSPGAQQAVENIAEAARARDQVQAANAPLIDNNLLPAAPDAADAVAQAERYFQQTVQTNSPVLQQQNVDLQPQTAQQAGEASVPRDPERVADAPTTPSGVDPAVTQGTAIASPNSGTNTAEAQILQSTLAGLRAQNINLSPEGNTLNAYDRYTYHLKLFMVGERNANDPYIGNKLASGSVQQVVIAESGVTTGFNITECEIDDGVGPGFRNRNTMTTEMRLSISEPYSLSLPDKIYLAARQLQINNWRMIPQFLSLEFRYINNEGQIVDPQAGRIQKLYKINISDFDSTLTAAGSVYKITAMVDNNFAFNNNLFIIPQSYTVKIGAGGTTTTTPTPNQPTITLQQTGTVAEFFTKLGEELTKFYKERRQPSSPPAGSNGGQTGAPTSGAAPTSVIVYKFVVAEDLGKESIKFNALSNNRRASFTSVNGAEFVTSRGISIGALVDDVLASLDEAKFFFTPNRLGQVRIPRVEGRVSNIGWDIIKNDYIREITYFIGYRDSIRAVPTLDTGREIQLSQNNQARMLREVVENTVKKVYSYYYTGLNTEIISLEITFNLLHMIQLPMLNGNTVPNPQLGSSREIGGAGSRIEELTNRIGEVGQQISAATRQEQIGKQAIELAVRERRRASNGRLLPVSEDNVVRWADATNNLREIQDRQAELRQEQSRLNAELSALQSQGLVFFDPSVATNIGIAEDTAAEEFRALFRRPPTFTGRLFAEDLNRRIEAEASRLNPTDIPTLLTYLDSPLDPMNQVRPTNTNDGDARKVYSTIIAQLYDREATDLVNIEMTIRGDPYWLGKSNVERTEELEILLPRTQGIGETSTARPSATNARPSASNLGSTSSPFANYVDRDANFLLVFRAGAKPSVNSGFMEFDQESVDFFNGLYTVTEVTHMFKEGKFTQKIKAMRNPLTSLNNKGQAPASANRNQPSVAPAATPPDGPSSRLPTRAQVEAMEAGMAAGATFGFRNTSAATEASTNPAYRHSVDQPFEPLPLRPEEQIVRQNPVQWFRGLFR